MQNNWDVNAVHAYVNERVSALDWHETPVQPKRKPNHWFQKLRTRFISLFWL